MKLGFRPEHAGLTEPGTPGSFAGEIYVVEPLGNETLVTVDLDGTLVNVRDAADFSGSAGDRCTVQPLLQHLHLFDDATGESLGAPAHVNDRPAEALIAATTQGGPQ